MITVPNRTSSFVKSIEVDPAAGAVHASFANGSTADYSDVSSSEIYSLLGDQNISLGFWLNNNCIKPQQAALVA